MRQHVTGCLILFVILVCLGLALFVTPYFWVGVAAGVVLAFLAYCGKRLEVPLEALVELEERMMRRFVKPPAPTPVAERPFPRLEALVGKDAVAVTPLMPGGFIEVEGEQESAVSDDGYLDPGTGVVIVGLRQSNLVVRRR